MDFLREPMPTMTHQFVDPTPFPLNVSSYFKRPAKIVKPNSRGDSPKNLSRRKTTASHSLHRRRAPGAGGTQRHGPIAHGAQAARPISWHPNTMSREAADSWSRLQPFPDSAYSMQMPQYPFSTTQVNGLITPLSVPSSGGSCYEETFTNLDDAHMSNTCSPLPFSAPINYDSLWSTPDPSFLHQIGTQSIDFSQIYHRLSQTQQAYLPTYLYKDTAPPTPEITPVANDNVFVKDEAVRERQAEPEGEVLVGMGLYDGPLSPPVIRGTAMTLPNRQSLGKGLILEETFEPSTKEDGDEDADADADEEEDEDEAASPIVGPVPQDTKPTTMQHSEIPVAKPIPNTQSLQSGSFFFDNDPEDNIVQDLSTYFANPVWNGIGSGQTWI